MSVLSGPSAPDGEHTIPRARPAGARQVRLVPPLLRNVNTVAGLLVGAIILSGALAAPVLAPYNPMAIVGAPLQWPGQNPAFPLGTDSLGRDVLSGILHGARISLLVGILATTLSLAIGILIGAVAGYFGGRIDDLIVRFIEIFQTIPGFVLLVVLVAFAQPSIATVVTGIAFTSWDTIARLTRAEFRALRERDFIAAARAAGLSDLRIIFREILPNAAPPLVVACSIMVASAILMESALSFMGLGDPNTMTWGSMIGAGRELIRTHWYLSALPGTFIVLTVLAFNLVGDGLNDVLNPRLRNSVRK